MSRPRVREWHGGKLTRPRAQWKGRRRGGKGGRSVYSATLKAQNDSLRTVLNSIAFARMKRGGD